MTDFPDYLNDEDKELMAKMEIFELFALEAMQAGAVQSPDKVGFIHHLHFTVLGSLDAADIKIDKKNVRTGLEVFYDEGAIRNALNPNINPEETITFKEPMAPETFIFPESCEDSEGDKTLKKLRARLQIRQQISDAMARGVRSAVNAKPEDSDQDALNSARRKITEGIRAQLEAIDPGCTSNKEHPIWKNADLLISALCSENINGGMEGAVAYAAPLVKPQANTPR